MRSFAPAAMLLAGLTPLFPLADGSASAQEQERKLAERLLQPDMTLQSDFQKKSFRQTGAFSAKASASQKPFAYRQTARTGSFFTRLFPGAKGFGSREKKAAVKEASTRGKYEPFDAARPYGTREVETRAARDAGRSVAVESYPAGEFQARGKSQKSLDRESAERKNLSIDQVRELLNKNE